MTVTPLDTGVLYAAIDNSDAHHRSCSRLLRILAGRLLVPLTVLVETSWHGEKSLGPEREAAFLAAVAAGELEIVALTDGDLERCGELVATYADMGFGFVDASVIALAERMRMSQVATIDRRHFTTPRPGGRTSSRSPESSRRPLRRFGHGDMSCLRADGKRHRTNEG